MKHNTMIEEKTLDEERALYNLKDAYVRGCIFAGPADGESALKECRKITVEDCKFSLRYPIWHTKEFTVQNCSMDEKTRAALWYCKQGKIHNSMLGGIKALRECEDVTIENCVINSPEFGWRSRTITLRNCEAESEYFMFEGAKLNFLNVKFKGKYSFQYVKKAIIENCDFSTKDAFWHSKNVTVRNSVLRGEYLGWYSENLTLENCLIIGTQPLCYCKNLTLKNCRMEGCDLSFEYSAVNATVNGEITSVKNPKSGKIIADGFGEIIFADANVPCKGRVITRKPDVDNTKENYVN